MQSLAGDKCYYARHVPGENDPLRLTGLPNVARYPEAEVSRNAEAITISFSGPHGEQDIGVPLKYVGGDEEAAELWLMARLQEMGYTVRQTDGSGP
jgi:hypothetical protein